MSQVAHQAGHYVGFHSKKRLEVLQPLSPPAPNISSGFPDNSPVPFYTPGWEIIHYIKFKLSVTMSVHW